MRRRRFGGVFVLLILFVFEPSVRAGFEIRNRQLFLGTGSSSWKMSPS